MSFGISLPKISLPKLDLGKIGQSVLKQGVEVLKGVAKDLFTPAKDGQHLFKTDINAKVGPFDIKLKNPVEALAEKLLGAAGKKLSDMGFDPNVLGKLLGGGQGGSTPALPGTEGGSVPALPERLDQLSKETKPAKSTKSTKTSHADTSHTKTKGTKHTSHTTTTKPAKEIGGGGAVGGTGGSTSPAPVTASNVSINSIDAGDRALEKFGGGISGLDKQIDDMLAKGGDLSSSDQIKLQRLMQKRSELFSLLTQIMQMEHETKKNTIGNIR